MRIIAVLFSLFFLSLLFAQPANDDCNGAVELFPVEFGSSNWVWSESGTDSGIPGCDGLSDDDVWFRFVANSPDDIISARDPFQLSDLCIEVFDACGGESVACGNNYPSASQERLRVGGLETGAEYHVRIYDSGIGSASTSLEVRVETFLNATLRPQDCGRTDFTLDNAVFSLRDDLGQLYDNSFVDVDGYGFEVLSMDASIGDTIQRTDAFPFSIVLDNYTFLQYGETYRSRVQHRISTIANGEVQEIWSPFGDECIIGLDSILPTAQLRAAFCDTMLFESTNILSDQVTGAELYRFTFIGAEGTYSYESFGYGMFLDILGSEGDALIQGTEYDVFVECQINGVWNMPGDTCTIALICEDIHPSSYLERPSDVLLACQAESEELLLIGEDEEAGMLTATLSTRSFLPEDIIHRIPADGTAGLDLFGLPGVAEAYEWIEEPYLIETDSGAVLSGTLWALDGSEQGWEVHLKLENKLDWVGWHDQLTISPPFIQRSYRDDFGHAADAGNAWETWDYFTIDSTDAYLSGLGSLEGSYVEVRQAPVNLLFGFQLGLAADNRSPEEGFSSWMLVDGMVAGEEISSVWTLRGHSEELGSMADQVCAPWSLEEFEMIDPCGNVNKSDRWIKRSFINCQGPQGLSVQEVDFDSEPIILLQWNDGEASDSCQVLLGLLDEGSVIDMSPEFSGFADPVLIENASSTGLEDSILIYDNLYIVMETGNHYGFEVRCQCADSSGWSPWSGMNMASTFLAPIVSDLENQNVAENTLLIFPNPSEGAEFYFSNSGIVQHYRIHDGLGREVYRAAPSHDMHGPQILPDSLLAGWYIISVETNSGIATFRWVITK